MTSTDAEPMTTSRSDWIWLILPYPLLLAASVSAWFSEDISVAEAPRVIVVGIVLIGWHSFWTVAHRHWLERVLAPMAVYYLGLIALCTVLLEVSISYLALYLLCYALAFVALPGAWAYVGIVVATAAPVLYTGALGWVRPDLSITLGGLALATLIGWSIRRLEAETAARKAALRELERAHDQLERAHQELEQALAENIGLQDQLVAEAKESGIATERARLAAEIHDTLAAALTGIVSQLEALDAELGPEHGAGTRVRTSTDLARDALTEARRSIRGLRPAGLGGRPLGDALAELTDAFRRTHDLPTQVHVTGEIVPVPADVETALLRIAGEAMTNVDRHSSADEVHLTLSYLQDVIALDIVDNGTGFDPVIEDSYGHGMGIMTERARHVGGRLEVRSRPGSGTTLTVSVPLPAPTEESPTTSRRADR